MTMITVCKTDTGYLVNGIAITIRNNQITEPDLLKPEEEMALQNFIAAEKNGLKIHQSCVN
jgi:hypothetical protein